MQADLIRMIAIVAMCIASQARAGEEKLPITADEFVYCTVCHGVQLMGNPILKAPRLSGMETWYTAQQLRNFRNETRGLHAEDPFGYEMQPMAAALSDDQIREVATFVNATQSPAPLATVEGNSEKGKALFSTCAACHGIDGKGNEALGSPDLTVTNDWYMVTQLRNFRSGSRGSAPGDIYGAQMRASVQLLADDEAIMDVVSYINTLQ
jgi:cytochrome c553